MCQEMLQHKQFVLSIILSVFALLSVSTIVPAFADTVSGSPIPVGSSPFGISVNPTTNKIYVANSGEGTVSVIDGSTGLVIGSPIPVGSSPFGISVNPTTNKIYVVNSGDGTVSVIDGSTDTVIATITVGNAPQGIGIDSVLNKIYVVNSGDGTVSVIDGSTDTVIATVAVGNNPNHIAVNETTSQVYVTNSGDNTVSQIDGNSNAIAGSPITTGAYPYGIAVNPVTNLIYTTNNADGTVTIIDGATATQISTITTMAGSASQPWGITVNPTTNKIYVSLNLVSGLVEVIDGSTGLFIGSDIPVRKFPAGIAVNPTTNKIYVANSGEGTVSVIDGATTTITPLAEKHNVISSLNMLTTVNDHNAKYLIHSINTLTKSVNSVLWKSDGVHLDATKGDKVFDYEKESVQTLMRITKDKEPQSFVDSLQNSINQLIDADKTIAATAISDASQIPDKNTVKEVAEAQKQMDKALVDIDKGNFDQAIEHYENAWEHAQNAQKIKHDNHHDHHISDLLEHLKSLRHTS